MEIQMVSYPETSNATTVFNIERYLVIYRIFEVIQ